MRSLRKRSARADHGLELLNAYHQHEKEIDPGGRKCDYWVRAAVGAAERARTFAAHGLTGIQHPKSVKVFPASEKAERLIEKGQARHQANLLRHIIGNPFRPYPPLDHLPQEVVQLADAMYNGRECAFALHDALLEAGHPELAEHFRQEKWQHPKGCWALDLIAGKQ